MIRLAIDGACKGNGKADCKSASGVVIIKPDGTFGIVGTDEDNSTSQRGELLALFYALEECSLYPNEEAQIITDSEYIFNAMTKGWISNWKRKGWVTANNDPVKNQDLWFGISEALESLKHEPIFYYIKGHMVPDGGEIAFGLLRTDPKLLYNFYVDKFEDYEFRNRDNITKAQELSCKNNGYKLEPEILKAFVALNMVADRTAVQYLINANN
jgi:ribonuclease HI